MRKSIAAPLLGLAMTVCPPVQAAPPTTLYASFFGGSSDTEIFDVRSNAAGEIYVAGRTTAADLPTTPGADRIFGGRSDGFVAKFSADGRTLLYGTYIGGPLYDSVTALALDAAGNAFAVGYTVDSQVGDGDAQAFVVKIVQNGAVLNFTVDAFGGPSQFPNYGGDDRASAVAVSPNGDIVVAGNTNSAIGFPLLNAMDSSLGGSFDGFLRRYDGNLVLLSSTYVGSNIDETLKAIAIGAAGNITLAGSNQDFPAHKDVWVARVNPAAGAFLWNSSYQGVLDEEALDLRVDGGGRVVVVGYTDSADFFTPGAIDTSYGGNSDGFLMRLATADGALEYCTFLGGPGIQGARAVELAANGDLVVAGSTQPDTDPLIGFRTRDGFVLRFNADLLAPLDYSVTFGGNGLADEVYGLARGVGGSILAAGDAGGSTFTPITGDAYQGTAPSSAPGFILRLGDDQDAPGTLRFAASVSIVGEGSGQISIEVERVGGTLGAVGIGYATVNGSAVAPGDYTAANNTLSFAQGQTSATILLNIADDALDEDTEQFTVVLSNPSGGASLGGTGSFQVNITDNDNPPTLSIDNGGCTVSEGNSGTVPCQFVLRLSAQSGKDVGFTVATGGGTATAGVDYTALGASARSILAGQLSATVSVNVLGDTAPEPNETFNLSVSAVGNAMPSSLVGLGTITNDDGAAPDQVFRSGFE